MVVYDHLQVVVSGPASAGVHRGIFPCAALTQWCAMSEGSLPPGQWLRIELDSFHGVRRGMFPKVNTCRHLCCQRATLQHWSFRLVSFCAESQHLHNEIDFAVSENSEGMKADNIIRVIILASATRLRVLYQQQHLSRGVYDEVNGNGTRHADNLAQILHVQDTQHVPIPTVTPVRLVGSRHDICEVAMSISAATMVSRRHVDESGLYWRMWEFVFSQFLPFSSSGVGSTSWLA